MIDVSKISNASLVGKALRWPLSRIPRGTLVPVLQGPLRGARWIVGSSVHGCWLGTYEAEKQRSFVGHLRPGDVFWDIGANVGFFTLLAARTVGKAGRVYAFEPVPDNCEWLRRHVELNAFANVELHELALGAEPAVMRFSRDVNASQGHLSPEGELEVKVSSIDTLVERGLVPPHVIKMDIEGAELDALLGGSATIERYRPHLFVATHGPEIHAGVCQWLRERDYELFSADGRPFADTDELLARPRVSRRFVR